MNDPFDVIFGGFDAFGDGDFLFSGQQWHLPHLFEVLAHRVVEYIQSGIGGFAGAFFGLDIFGVRTAGTAQVFVFFDFCLIDDREFHGLQAVEHLFDQIRIEAIHGQGLVQVVVGQVILFLGQTDQGTEAGLNFRMIDGIIFFRGG